MKIRLLGQGYENFTGAFGDVEFLDGVSVHDVSPNQARFYAALMSIENVDTGTDPGDNARFQSSFELEAVTTNLPTLAEIQAQGGNVASPTAVVESKTEAVAYSQEKLEEVADKGGINALREIAEQFGVKGTSIAKLIAGILSAQSKPEPAAITLAEGQPEVATAEQSE